MHPARPRRRVIVGAATVRTEGYGPPRKAGQRIGVVSRRGDVDPTTAAVHQRRRLPDPARGRAGDADRLGPRRRRRARPRRRARASSTSDFVQAEGGPTLNGALARRRPDRRAQPDDLAAARRRRRAAAVTGGAAQVVAPHAPGPRPRGRRLPVHPLRAPPTLTTGTATSAALQLLQQDQLALEVGGGVEVLVDAGEAQVGDLVEAAQPLEHLEAELGRR